MRVIYAWKANPAPPSVRSDQRACSTNPRIVGKMPTGKSEMQSNLRLHGPPIQTIAGASTLCVTLSANPSCWSPNRSSIRGTHLHCPRPRNLERPRAKQQTSPRSRGADPGSEKDLPPPCRAYHTKPQPGRRAYVVFAHELVYGFFTISTRLFLALPFFASGYRQQVSLSQPTNDILVLSTPLAIRAP